MCCEWLVVITLNLMPQNLNLRRCRNEPAGGKGDKTMAGEMGATDLI